MNPKREEKFKRVIQKRQPNFSVILENVHDAHNIGAVLRTCDSVGIMEVYILYTTEEPRKLTLGKRTSAGARKWVDTYLYDNAEECFAAVRAKYDKVYCTHLDEKGTSVYELDLCESVALVFGNEKDGISQEVLDLSDGNFIIPQVGMVESLNISVACAVSLYEGLRQRKVAGMYDENRMVQGEIEEKITADYTRRHKEKLQNSFPLNRPPKQKGQPL